MQAGAADGAKLHQGDAGALPGGMKGGDVSSGPGAQNHDSEAHFGFLNFWVYFDDNPQSDGVFLDIFTIL
jgi:hypothetical protein